jgi:hypothetical protein
MKRKRRANTKKPRIRIEFPLSRAVVGEYCFYNVELSKLYGGIAPSVNPH